MLAPSSDGKAGPEIGPRPPLILLRKMAKSLVFAAAVGAAVSHARRAFRARRTPRGQP
jgi:hypothetical protein